MKYQPSWLKDYNLTQAQFDATVDCARAYKEDVDNSTQLAESVCNDDEFALRVCTEAPDWLDQETHPIWEIADWIFDEDLATDETDLESEEE